MKPPKFDYYAPRSLGKALDLLAKHGAEAKILAGGQSLMPLVNMRLARPRVLVDLARIRALRYIRREKGSLAIGAMTTSAEIEASRVIRKRCPLLAEAAKLIGHPAIRNRGTVGGSIAHADPAAELPAVLKALDGQVRVRGPQGEREIGAEELFVGPLTTSLQPEEVLAGTSFKALGPGAGWAVEEFTRRHGDFAIAGVVTCLSVDGNRINNARVVLFGVGDTPVRIREVEAVLNGTEGSEELFNRAAEGIPSAIDPPTDIHGSADYRRHLARVLTLKALRKSLERARGRTDTGGRLVA